MLLTGYADRIFVSTLNKSQTNMACKARKERHLGNIFYIVQPTVHKPSKAVMHSIQYKDIILTVQNLRSKQWLKKSMLDSDISMAKDS